ncbi:formylglycine-generating enzyme family protein [Thiothrix nivea]|uniref:formylglycine-generating enzyme family protein n=1 Tax=Thiothrix nivea TaxID=1031 RepID=UPI001B7F9B8C|nr:formylglycine-generating enzyme family protein [Thiothrix nivea]
MNAALHSQAGLLLDALSPVIRLEPGLLRQMRLAMAQHGKRWQIGEDVESLVWQHGDIQDAHSVAATWNRDARKLRLQRFMLLSRQERLTALDVIRQWRQPLPKQIWFEEITSLDLESRDLLEADVQAADAYFQQLSEQVQSEVFLMQEAETRDWLQRVSWRMPETALENATVGKALQRIKFMVAPEASGIDPRNLSASDAPEKRVMLYQQGESISLDWPVPSFQNVAVGSPLGMIRLRHELVRIEVDGKAVGELPLWSMSLGLPGDASGFKAISDLETLYFKQAQKPGWADSIGRDTEGLYIEHSCLGKSYRSYWQNPEADGASGYWQGVPPGDIGMDDYGLYADLPISNIPQRFRWIEPGTFLMGSPESEPERWAERETQHQVTLTQGFWLADTTVTQAQWQAVMGNNPSNFKDAPNNPVEQISWNDAQAFIKKLNQQTPGLQAKLPTEAEWEYACRAGTITPFSFGDNITPEQVNYAGNYPHAGGKKGLYRKQTVLVKSLPSNPWGLYEMHGNVWEWCQDVWQEKLPAEPVTDPKGVAGGDKEAGVGRVLRGGSWDSVGWYCRSASRSWSSPGFRHNALGCRLALGHSEFRPGGGAAGSGATVNKQGRADGAGTGSRVAEQRQTVTAPGAGKSRKKPKKRK